jgi:hypothetical protein
MKSSSMALAAIAGGSALASRLAWGKPAITDTVEAQTASPYLLLIHAKDELSVSADMNNEMLGSLRNIEEFPEAQNDTISQWCAGRGDPLCFPQSSQSFSWKLR